MKHPALALVPFVLVWAGMAHAAGPIYRCGGGTYSQVPCAGATLVEAADPRTAAQRAEARRAAAAERKAAQTLERDRLAAEKSRPAIASLGPTNAASAPARDGGHVVKGKGTKKGKAKSHDDAHFVAVDPSAKKKPSRRQ
jgi:hypothetical protein